METVFPKLIAIFAVIGFFFSLSPLFSDKPTKKYNQQRIRNNLYILHQTNDSNKKADAFIALMFLSYISIHIMGNRGGKYDDARQMERFKKFLTPTALKKLNELG